MKIETGITFGQEHQSGKNSWGKYLYIQGKVPVDLPGIIDDIINVGLEKDYASGARKKGLKFR